MKLVRVGLIAGALVALAACRTERIEPGGAARASRVASAIEEASIVAALETYYDRFSRRDWPAFRESFWPGATIAVRWQPHRNADPVAEVQSIDAFLQTTQDGPDRLAVFDERMVFHEVRQYGDLAQVWATFRATFALPGAKPATHFGVDAFHLLKDRGEWRIVSMAFTQELPGDSLPRTR